MTISKILLCAAALTTMLGLQACNATSGGGNQINFGNDTSQWAFDGECDDPRFAGPGTAQTLLQEDAYRDASDCRNQFYAGSVWLAAGTNTNTNYGSSVNFGDDQSQWAHDGECDDPRFYGAGMTTTPLLDEDRFHDASDCRRQYEAGRIALR
jgi:hypothetical protein